jgi:transposase
MALHYVSCDRDQLMLLPADVREYVPADHLASFIVEVVEDIDTSGLHARHANEREGRPAYDPDVLLALCLYGATAGVRSSRKLEGLCTVDLGARYITANRVPDHATVARFLREHQAAFTAVFVELLRLCAEAGMAQVGVVALDGTKVAANASLAANATRDRIAAEADAIVAEMLTADDADDARLGAARRGDEFPPELVDRRRRRPRLGRLQAALGQIDEQQAETEGPVRARLAKADAKLAAEQERMAEYERRAAEAAEQGRKPPGRPPVGEGSRLGRARAGRARAQAAADHHRARAPARANVTDPDSRIMKTRHGWTQGYNAQAVVNQHGVILAAAVTNDHNDVAQFDPMIKAAAENLAAVGVDAEIGTVLADAGYCSDDNLTSPGPDRLIATTRSWKLRKQVREQGHALGPPPEDATPRQAMEHRLMTQDGEALYKLRCQTVEPVFGQIKEGGLRRFLRRGRDAVTAEWHLACSAHNLLKLFRHRQRAPAVL